ncbi:MAG: methyltransferase domain-containing protein [Acidimicrobiia bacterium]|nr:methyltransferase domain-containing protein [Acidimicrobiia bacterium]
MTPSRGEATEAVRRFYDRNTSTFLRYGQGGGTMHRAVWGPGVSTRDEAFGYVDELIARLIQSCPAPEPHVLDLGCGVGASLCRLAARLPIRGTGVTLSPVQVQVAGSLIADAGLAGRVRCVEADFTSLPPMPPVDVAYAIESFVHGSDPARFFAECARVIAPGGLLVICDDVLAAEPSDPTRPIPDPRAARTLARFRLGWRVHTLIDVNSLAAQAAAAGFRLESSTDLTPHLELRRPRDRAVAVLAALFGWLPLDDTRAGHLFGGHALQTALRAGWLAYRFIVVQRVS